MKGQHALADNKVRFETRRSVTNRAMISQDHLLKFPLFVGRDAHFVECLAMECEVTMFSAGDVIVKEGDLGETTFFLVIGSVAVFKSIDDTETKVAELGAGVMFGEMALLQAGAARRTATVTALEFCDCRVVHQRVFNKILKRFPMERQYYADMARQRLEDLANITAAATQHKKRRTFEISNSRRGSFAATAAGERRGSVPDQASDGTPAKSSTMESGRSTGSRGSKGGGDELGLLPADAKALGKIGVAEDVAEEAGSGDDDSPTTSDERPQQQAQHHQTAMDLATCLPEHLRCLVLSVGDSASSPRSPGSPQSSRSLPPQATFRRIPPTPRAPRYRDPLCLYGGPKPAAPEAPPPVPCRPKASIVKIAQAISFSLSVCTDPDETLPTPRKVLRRPMMLEIRRPKERLPGATLPPTPGSAGSQRGGLSSPLTATAAADFSEVMLLRACTPSPSSTAPSLSHLELAARMQMLGPAATRTPRVR